MPERRRPPRQAAPDKIAHTTITPSSVAADDFTVSVLRGAYWQLQLAELGDIGQGGEAA